MAMWCEDRNFNGFARYFYKQSTEEREHPRKFIEHLLDRGVFQWFISEQVEMEDWAQEMVDRLARADCPGGLADLDRHIERYLSKEVTPQK